jgi:hypothetical protein
VEQVIEAGTHDLHRRGGGGEGQGTGALAYYGRDYHLGQAA